MTDATPTQPTGSGKLIWRKPLTRDVVEFGTLPDPRDEQIEMLEAALKAIYAISDNWDRSCVDRLEAIRNTVRAALMPPPEGDMRETVEELDA